MLDVAVPGELVRFAPQLLELWITATRVLSRRRSPPALEPAAQAPPEGEDSCSPEPPQHPDPSQWGGRALPQWELIAAFGLGVWLGAKVSPTTVAGAGAEARGMGTAESLRGERHSKLYAEYWRPMPHHVLRSGALRLRLAPAAATTQRAAPGRTCRWRRPCPPTGSRR